MKITAQQISSLLQHADIEGYIEFGAPLDEYSEAEALALALGEIPDEDITKESVSTITMAAWKKSFNLSDSDMLLRKSAIDSFAQQIIKFRSGMLAHMACDQAI